MRETDNYTGPRVTYMLDGSASPVDIARHQTDHLLVQTPHYHLQERYDFMADRMGLGDPDRISIHDPVTELVKAGENPGKSTLVAWMKKLHELHGFNTVHILESNKTEGVAINAARAAIISALPELAIRFHLIEDDKNAKPSETVVASCSDFRFFKSFREMMQERVGPEADRLFFPAPEKSILDPLVKERITAMYREVHIIGHTACGGFGGMEAYDNLEPLEAMAHMREGRHAKAVLTTENPDSRVNLYLRGVNAPIEIVE